MRPTPRAVATAFGEGLAAERLRRGSTPAIAQELSDDVLFVDLESGLRLDHFMETVRQSLEIERAVAWWEAL